ncbi:MAG: phytoene/squalene synthase family protein [Planctomycetota bacterium]
MSENCQLLTTLLKNVSRSFYLTIRVLPHDLREPVGLAYLLARAADTIADTQIIAPTQRLELLLAFRQQINAPLREEETRRIEAAVSEHQVNPHEKRLLQSLVPALALLSKLNDHDRREVRRVVTTLTTGMELDLTVFPLETSGQLTALPTCADLDRYIYLVAGCVGEFWTNLTVTHTSALRSWDIGAMSACGAQFGKALQMTNILRDCPRDLRIGRCYLPLERLQSHQLSTVELLKPENSTRARPVLLELLRITLGHYREAQRYLLAIPPRCRRLRLACLWPIIIGLSTLKKLAANQAWLDPAKPSIVSRAYVYKTIAISLPVIGSDKIVQSWISRLISAVEDEVM